MGHPKLITKQFQNLKEYEGLIKCKVLPPRNLYIPVLPCKMNDKLVFALCKTFAETQRQTPCTHTDEERAFVGVWATDEVKKVLEKRYKI